MDLEIKLGQRLGNGIPPRHKGIVLRQIFRIYDDISKTVKLKDRETVEHMINDGGQLERLWGYKCSEMVFLG